MGRGHFDRTKRVEKSIKTAQSAWAENVPILHADILSRIDFVGLAGAFGYSDVFYEGLYAGRGGRSKARYCQSHHKVQDHTYCADSLGRDSEQPILGVIRSGIDEFEIDDVGGGKRDACKHT